jgi:Zn finger protein HypA/HybF involved in hydrogenase expression
MSVLPDRNIWIPSRVPQSLPCAECGHTSKFVTFVEPEQYRYTCPACQTTRLLTLSQINATEARRFHKLPKAPASSVIGSRMTGAAKQ